MPKQSEGKMRFWEAHFIHSLKPLWVTGLKDTCVFSVLSQLTQTEFMLTLQYFIWNPDVLIPPSNHHWACLTPVEGLRESGLSQAAQDRWSLVQRSVLHSHTQKGQVTCPELFSKCNGISLATGHHFSIQIFSTVHFQVLGRNHGRVLCSCLLWTLLRLS